MTSSVITLSPRSCEGSEVRIDIVIIRDVIAIIAHGRGIKRQQPDGGHPQLLEIIKLLDQTAKIADPVAVAVVKGLHVQLVDDRVLVPKRIGERITQRLCHAANSWRNNSHGAIVRFPQYRRQLAPLEGSEGGWSATVFPPLSDPGRNPERKDSHAFRKSGGAPPHAKTQTKIRRSEQRPRGGVRRYLGRSWTGVVAERGNR